MNQFVLKNEEGQGHAVAMETYAFKFIFSMTPWSKSL